MKIFTLRYYIDGVEDYYQSKVLAETEEQAQTHLINDHHPLEAYGFDLIEEEDQDTSAIILEKKLLN